MADDLLVNIFSKPCIRKLYSTQFIRLIRFEQVKKLIECVIYSEKAHPMS